MTRARWAVVLCIAGTLVALGAPPATAGCGAVSGDLGEVSQACEYTNAELTSLKQEDSASAWEVYQICKDGTSGGAEVCSNPSVCELRGSVGTWYVVRRDGVTIGRACLTNAEAIDHGVDITVLVSQVFRELDWPGSELSVQPPGGKTLVNLETIFFTTNIKPTTKTVTLAGRNVTIEATPTSYSWDFGDGANETTASAGHPHPDHDVFHVYATTDLVGASVATTYTGRFRIGDAEWQNIPDTLTVAGEPVALEVLEAKPQLVLR